MTVGPPLLIANQAKPKESAQEDVGEQEGSLPLWTHRYFSEGHEERLTTGWRKEVPGYHLIHHTLLQAGAINNVRIFANTNAQPPKNSSILKPLATRLLPSRPTTFSPSTAPSVHTQQRTDTSAHLPSSCCNPSTEVIFTARLGVAVCGHRDIVHGGLTATLFDDVMGSVAFEATGRSQEYCVVTKSLKVDYRRPLKAGSEVLIKGNVRSVEGGAENQSNPRMVLECKLFTPEHEEAAKAEAVFVVVRREIFSSK
eukprot:GHVS01021661.1.p1 GENE.GHVS01021661.1~~GHVS01021661.1.p1  ORF type:complete len:264 (+),score=23.92 GHVS01021661.1:28-792(+)